MNTPTQTGENNQSDTVDQEKDTSSGVFSAIASERGLVSRRNLLRTGAVTTGFLSFTLPLRKNQLDNLPTIVGTVSAQSASWTQQNIFSEPDVSDSTFPKDAIERFGVEVALSDDGDTAFVAAPGKTNINNEGPPGSVFVYTRDSDASWVWNRRERLVPDDSQNNGFGNSVSVSSSSESKTVVIGAPFECIPDPDETDCINAGAVHVYTGSGDTWSQQARLTPTNPAIDDQFGSDVAVSGDGDTVVIGVPSDETDDPYDGVREGFVYIFVRDGGTWTQQAKLEGPEPESPPNSFGGAVAISNDGNTIVIGDVNTSIDTSDQIVDSVGGVYMYTRTSSGTWSKTGSFIPGDADEQDYFGAPIAMSGDGTTAMVGIPWEEDSTGERAGSAYVLTENDGTWSQQTKLIPDDGDSEDIFGTAISITDSGDTAIIGASQDEDPNGEDAGSAYVFKRDSNGWSQQTKLYTSSDTSDDSDDELFDNPDSEAGRLFGSSVSLTNSGETAVIGAPTTSGFVENRAYEFAVEDEDNTDSEEELTVTVTPEEIVVGTEREITVSVTDISGSSVEEATVEIPDLVKEGTTNSNGVVDFTIAPNETADYLVTAIKNGYSDGESTVSVVREESDTSGDVDIKNATLDEDVVAFDGSTHTLTFDVENLSTDGSKDEFDIELPTTVDLISVNNVTVNELPDPSYTTTGNTIEFSVDPDQNTDIGAVEFTVDITLSPSSN